MENRVQSFRDLLVWQKAMDLTEQVYRVTKKLPADEQFGLISQQRRAAVSIPANIAEGHARSTRGEYRQFLGHSNGSAAELETLTLICERLNYLDNLTSGKILEDLDEVQRMPGSLHRKLR